MSRRIEVKCAHDSGEPNDSYLILDSRPGNGCLSTFHTLCKQSAYNKCSVWMSCLFVRSVSNWYRRSTSNALERV
jgi:hypothetical protein